MKLVQALTVSRCSAQQWRSFTERSAASGSAMWGSSTATRQCRSTAASAASDASAMI